MIRLLDIYKTFHPGKANEVQALKGINLDIAPGTFLVLVGSNGSGKSTLLNILAGSLFPDRGKVYFQDQEVSRLPDYARSRWTARVFQDPLGGTAPELSILDNFRLAALRRSPKKLRIGTTPAFREQVRERIAGLGMGLENKLDQAMGTLSGGQRQALTLLMSVMDQTDILLLDEPTAALDPQAAHTVMETARQLILTHGLTAILVTHDMKEAVTYGDRLVQLHRGQVLRDLSGADKQALLPEDIYQWFLG
jgi:putative ABC transport system ATP-binding protein